MSSSSILNITFDCVDSDRVSRFWSEVMRWPREKVEMPGNPYWWVGPDEETLPHLVFVEVADPKRGKNRVHLDLLPRGGTQEQEIARLQGLGARVIDDRRDATPGGWVVLADPEGNELCLETSG